MILRPVDIAGVGTLTAAGAGLEALWDALIALEPLARPVTRYDTDGLTTRCAALLDDSTTRRLATRWPGLDLPARMALDCVEQATRTVTLQPTAALFVGTSLGSVGSWEPWHRALVGGERSVPPAVATHDDTAEVIARELGLRGPVVTVSTACTSSTTALIQAADAIRLGECDQAVVVGVDAIGRFVHAGFESLGALSPEELPPAPFAGDRAGLWLGDGAAAVILSRDAGGLGRLLGGGIAADGVHMTATDRAAGGLLRAARRALFEAGVSPAEVAWVSAHATSTRFNDGTEAVGLRGLFPDGMPPVHCAKPVIGHTLGACGLVEVAIVLEALRRRVRPPTYAPRPLDPSLGAIPLDRAEAPLMGRRALSLNAAMGGHNTAVLLEGA